MRLLLNSKHLATLFILLSCGIISDKLSAQTTWCPPGAIWYEGVNAPNTSGFFVSQYAGDTILAGIACKKISGKAIIKYGSAPVDTQKIEDLLTYSAGDTVYFFVDDRFLAYYYFNAQVGDTLILPNDPYGPDATINAIVDSIGTMQVANTTLRYYVYHVLDSCGTTPYPSEKVVERLGMITKDMLPSWSCSPDNYLRCYYDYSVYKTYFSECDYIATGVKEIKEDAISIEPNPAINVCSLHLKGVYDSKPELYDVAGENVSMLFTQSGSSVYDFNVEGLSAGLYFVSIKNAEGVESQAKLIKQ